ncbi:hypothetical protein [uncultured Thiodictyon sp.]|uniref:hypothetical protein n=1 Tax=uncultured Thiodictyon sp. TaxID=1846217 RepID=UPI0025FA2EBB|nr:hypothetical protein [uncultured Thiodictyon sp.]
MGGLIELLFIVALLGWFWSSQRAALRKDPGTDRGAGSEAAPQPTRGEPPAP